MVKDPEVHLMSRIGLKMADNYHAEDRSISWDSSFVGMTNSFY